MKNDTISTYLDLKKYDEELTEWAEKLEDKLAVHVKDSVCDIIETLSSYSAKNPGDSLFKTLKTAFNGSEKKKKKEAQEVAIKRDIIKILVRTHEISAQVREELAGIVTGQVTEAYIVGRAEGAYEDARLFSKGLRDLVENGSIADESGRLIRYVDLVMEGQERKLHKQMEGKNLNIYTTKELDEEDNG